MPRKKPQNIKAHGGRFGPGKIHYSAPGAEYGVLITLCGRTIYGEFVDAKENPVTCKLCIRTVPG